MPSSVVDLLSGWGTLLGRGPVFRIWKQVPLCVLWGLWGERNSTLFEDVEVSVGALCRKVLNMLYLWVTAHSPGSLLFADFLLFLVLSFPLFRGTFVYFLCTRVVPLCAF
jgi:hypothetical protein